MDFKEFVEHWAHVYQPILHVPGKKSKNQRFFFCDGFAQMADWMRTQNFDKSPVVLMESGEDITINSSGWEYHDYVIYFAVRAKKQGDGYDADACKREAVKHARQFLLYVQKHMSDFRKDMKIPDIEQVNLSPIGPLWDAWNMVQMRITVAEGECKNVDEELIVEDGSTENR